MEGSYPRSGMRRKDESRGSRCESVSVSPTLPGGMGTSSGTESSHMNRFCGQLSYTNTYAKYVYSTRIRN